MRTIKRLVISLVWALAFPIRLIIVKRKYVESSPIFWEKEKKDIVSIFPVRIEKAISNVKNLNSDLQSRLYKYTKVIVDNEGAINLVSLIERLYGNNAFDMMLTYGDYINKMYEDVPNIIFYNEVTKKELEDRLIDSRLEEVSKVSI